MMMNNVKEASRVVVTGMGIVSPNGIGLDAFWDSLVNCRSGIAPITAYDTRDLPLKFAGEVRPFDLRTFLGNDCKPNRLARQTQLGLAACSMAVEHAGLSRGQLAEHAPLHLVIGISCSAIDIIARAKEILMTRGADRIRPCMVGSCQPHAVGAAIMQYLGTQCSVTTLSAACPSALDALADAAQLIRSGQADLVIAGAADSPLDPSSASSFAAAGIPSRTETLPPEEVSRPFDAKRTGVVLSEGAGFVVLERLDCALARGADPIIEIAGGATLSDAPGADPMEGLHDAMRCALNQACLRPADIDYICANACSDPEGDIAEVVQIKRLLGKRARQIPVSSIRGVTGHSLAPAGMFQVIATALMMRHQIVCPTANLHDPDPACDLDHVPLTPRRAALRVALVNSHGIGGENSSLVLRKAE